LLTSLLLLLLLLLGALLVLAHADGAAWVQAALVRDLFCSISCPTCSSASCWVGLLCVHKHCSSILQTKVFLWPARRLFHRCFLHLSLSPFHLLLLSLLLGREEAGGPLVARDLQNNLNYTNPTESRRTKKDIPIIKLTAVIRRAQNDVYVGCCRKGTVPSHSS
jgi:hypothetical protein